MNKTTFTENTAHSNLTVERSFPAPVDRVWAAWTEPDLLEQWWAPAPWKAVSQSFDFREGGRWHYYMQGPDGERHWCLADFGTIEPLSRLSARDAFCDEQAQINSELPATDWEIVFTAAGEQTRVRVTLAFVSAEELNRLVEMGFKDGFSLALDQLEALLA